MGGSTPSSISPIDLYARVGTADVPLLFDVRRAAGFAVYGRTLSVVGARSNPVNESSHLWSSLREPWSWSSPLL